MSASVTALHLGRSEWPQAGTCLMAVAVFFAGTAVGSHWQGSGEGVKQLRVPLVAEIVLFACGLAGLVALGPETGKPVLIACLCLALGVQNGALQRVGALSVHTTYMTGLLTTLLADLTAGPVARPRRNVLAGVFGSFVAGAACGGVLVDRGGPAGFAAILAPAFVALLLAAAARRPPDPEPRTASQEALR